MLVPPKDSDALGTAIQELMARLESLDPDLIVKHARKHFLGTAVSNWLIQECSRVVDQNKTQMEQA
jgi:hypothetical protein